MMNTNHWLVIDTLVDCLHNGIDRKKLREATLQLDKELDRRLVDNLPIDEIKRLKSVLERLNYENE